MSMVQRLIKQLEQRGLRIAPGTERGTLLLHGPSAEKTPAVMDALRKFKPLLLKIYSPEDSDGEPAPDRDEAEPADEPEPEACRVCGRDVSDPETRALLAFPLHCDRGGARAATDAQGVHHPAAERCPYKPGRAA